MMNHKPRRRGVTAVEFAITAPIFFFVLIAGFEFGWHAVIRHTADNAAYEAARIAIVPGATAAEATAEADRIMRIVGARSFNIDVNPAALNVGTESVEVTVSGQYDLNGIIAAKVFPSTGFESRSRLLTERPR